MFDDWGRLISLRLLLALIIILIVGSLLRGNINPEPLTTTTTTTTKFIYTEYNLNRMIEIIAEEEDFDNVYLLKQLAWHESRYLKYPEVLEKTGWYSRGLFHFRTSTFLEQGIKYGVIQKDTTIEQALTLIYNPELQIRIACRMGKENMRLIRKHWFNSYNKIYCD